MMLIDQNIFIKMENLEDTNTYMMSIIRNIRNTLNRVPDIVLYL